MLFFSLLAMLAVQAAADCTIDTLKNATDQYVTAQTAGQTTMAMMGDSVAYTENRKTKNLKTGILSQAVKPDHTRNQHDIEQCATYTELIVANSVKPYVIGMQMRLDNATYKIAKMDSIVTTNGDWLFNVTGTLYWASKETWDEIPAEKRVTRATIQAAADAYCDIFDDKSVKVPWGTPCARLEGGSYTGKGQSTDRCDVGIPSGVKLVNRQYVIDGAYGTVDIMMDFGGPGAMPNSHDFRVEDGKLRYVHTMSVCGSGGCNVKQLNSINRVYDD